MDPEVTKLLKENLELSKLNNQLLMKLASAQRRAQIVKYIYWGIIIFSSIGAYYFIQPFLGNILNIYSGGISGMENIGDVTKKLSNKQQMEDFVNSMKSNR